jgi:hypothetical protein
MSDRLKVLLGALGGAVLALLLAGGLSGSGMGYGMISGMGRMMGRGVMGGRLVRDPVLAAILGAAPDPDRRACSLDPRPGPPTVSTHVQEALDDAPPGAGDGSNQGQEIVRV